MVRTTAALAEVSAGLPVPVPEVLADDFSLDRWVAARLGTSRHTCGTVPPGDAVDRYGRVRGVTGLRVADTSILPTPPLRCGARPPPPSSSASSWRADAMRRGLS